ncbi:MAG: amino acid racemase [Candidatus Baltobacteraceae bacterium]
MKHIGIVACSAEGAALCYRTICAAGAEQLGGHAHPEVSMHTPSFEAYVECLNAGEWSGVADLMIASAAKLADAGADFLICPDNTIHQALPDVLARTSLPWLHIADVVADEACRRRFRRVGIMGTRWLVDGPVYSDAFDARGLAYLRPEPADRDEVNRIIFDELVRGEFKPASIAYFRAVTERLKVRGCDSVVLGCTELPLVLDDANAAVAVLDSTRLLARAAVRRAIEPAIDRVNSGR